MAQRINLPLDNARVNASYMSQKYLAHYGYNHFGVDLGSSDDDKTIFSMGDGRITHVGLDGSNTKTRLGYCVVGVLDNVQLNDGTIKSLAFRMFHLDSILCKVGNISKGDIIGVYGNTGALSSGPHLHIEFDTDITWPQYAWGIAADGNVIKKGKYNSSVNPSNVWCIGKNQSITTYENWITDKWVTKEDILIPKEKDNIDAKTDIQHKLITIHSLLYDIEDLIKEV